MHQIHTLISLVSSLVGGFLILLLHFFFYQYIHVLFPIKKKKIHTLISWAVNEDQLYKLLNFFSKLGTFMHLISHTLLPKYKLLKNGFLIIYLI